MYDPRDGRFLQTDPIGHDDGLNMYIYVGNNPLTWIDPFGEFTIGIGSGGLGGASFSFGGGEFVFGGWGRCEIRSGMFG